MQCDIRGICNEVEFSQFNDQKSSSLSNAETDDECEIEAE